MCWLKVSPTGSKQRLGLVSGAAPGREGGRGRDRGRESDTGSERQGRAGEQGGVLGYIRSLLLGKEEL